MKDLFHLFNSDMSFGESLVFSLLGMVIVFLMLAVLMYIIKLVGLIMKSAERKERSAPLPVMIKEETGPLPHERGDVLFINDVPARTAVMVMALVADRLKKPLNELLFKSIREVK